MFGRRIVSLFLCVVLVIGFSIFRLTFDRKGNQALLNEVQMTLMTEYFPNEITNIKKKGSDSISAGSIDLNIKEINVSYPFYSRSNRYKTGVLKVNFTLTDSNKIIKDGISFYRFSHSPISDDWDIRDKTSKYNYFMKIIF
jgi:hypothetical protein